MSFIPHTNKDRIEMMNTIGVDSLDDLYPKIPAKHRFPDLNLPSGISEMEVMGELRSLSESNRELGHNACFLGAGAYNHFIPSVVDHILRRNEFYTAYTPYQPEVSQGTLQTIFEYQSMMCALTQMDVSNASHYDGATALAEAVVMAMSYFRGKRNKVVLSPLVHPQYREVVRTYLVGQDISVEGDESFDVDLETLKFRIDDHTALVAVQYPDFLGSINDLTDFGKAVHDAGALFCVVVNPIALGMLRPPSEFGADIVVGEGQPLGIPLSYGGPYLGIFTTRQKYVRKMAGRLAGETVDTSGKPGYALTLSTREQHIRRGKASSNICTNQGLMTLATTVYLGAMGKQGLGKVARLCYDKAHYAAKQVDALEHYSLRNKGSFFHEFVVECPRPVSEINSALLEKNVIGGYDLGQSFDGRDHSMLLAVTEMCSRDQIDLLVSTLKEVSHG
ncbi:MAG: aminomethyl-transferring glycine dehydrogenase subunit GcvPA [Deltaproteobacteria bacterium]|nr:aminomethyl-transferring glycine dehydrogenase subunit GcvPA [Deltaproteobacteria bacterium]